MSLNLLDLLKGQIGSQVIKQASSFLGESESATSSAMGGILPSLLGGLMSNASSKSGAGALLDMLGSGGYDGSILTKLPGLLAGGDATSGFVKQGSGLMDSLFGDKVGGLVSMISGLSGLKSGSSSSLLSMAAPLVMGMLGKQKSTLGINSPSGLASLLMGQKDYIKDSLPAGFSDAMGISGGLDSITRSAEKEYGSLLSPVSGLGKKVVGKTTENVSRAAGATVGAGTKVVSGAADVATDAAATGGSILKWLIPLLLALAVGAWALSKLGCSNSAIDGVNNTTQSTINKTTDVAGAAAGAAGSVVDKTAGAVGAAGDAVAGAADAAGDAVADGLSKIKLAGGKTMDFVKGSFGEKFTSYVVSSDKSVGKVFTFNNVNFATGKSALASMPNKELDNLAEVLKAYPNVHIRLEGHTDNKGNANNNLKLSQARAETVKGYLLNKGIEANRLAAKGFGASKPVAKNDTEEGRAKNRRTDAVITKK